MLQTLRRAGGSLEMTVPKAFIEQNQPREGSQVELLLDGARMTVSAPCKRRYTLDELMAEMSGELPRVEGWDVAGRQGKAVMAYTPDRGDTVRLQPDPASGQKMKGPHFGWVVSARVFNSRGPAMICPISQGAAAAARTCGTVVTLMGSGTVAQGAVHCHRLKSLDWRVRKAKFKQAVPAVVIDDVAPRIEAILPGE